MSKTSRHEVSRTEWWPVYTLDLDPRWRDEEWVKEFGHDIPVELIARYEKNLAEFVSIQGELQKIAGEAA